jgi:hypothetical protein
VDQRIIDRFRRDVESDEVLFEELETVCDLSPGAKRPTILILASAEMH